MHYENFCKVLAKIEADPNGWNQRSFYGNCFLGIAADMAGRNGGAFDRLVAGARFVGIELFRAGYVGAADLTLDHFRRMRHVMATRRFLAAGLDSLTRTENDVFNLENNMSTDTELQSEITAALLKQKDVIVKGLVDGAIDSVQRDLGWRAGNIAAEVVNNFIKTDVLPALTAELEARKAEIVTGLVAGLLASVDVAAKKMAEQTAKHLASGWNLKKVAEAMLG